MITPSLVGKYQLQCSVNGTALTFPQTSVLNVIDPQTIKLIVDSKKATVDQPFKFSIDASKAGNSILQVIVEDNNGSTCTVQSLGKAKNDLENFSFTPTSSGSYTIKAKYGNIDVDTLNCEIISSYDMDSSKIKIVVPEVVRCTKQANLLVDTTSCGKAPIRFELLDPLNNKIEMVCSNDQSKHDLSFVPVSEGWLYLLFL